MNIMRMFLDWFWRPSVWLPPNTTWIDLSPTNSPGYPDYTDLYIYPIIFASLLIFFRYIIAEPFILCPLGRYLGVCEHVPSRPSSNVVLERAYKSFNSKVPPDILKKLSLDLNLSIRIVERWIRQRSKCGRSSAMSKFVGCSWELCYYVSFLFMGFVVLRGRHWIWDIRHCYIGFPRHPIDNRLWWYYMVATSHYLSMSLTFLFQTKRKDNVQMFLHHIVTLCLLTLSWVINLVRLGTLVLVVHEVADIPLNIAKIFGYMKKQNVMDYVFVLFMVVWICTRLGIFPFWILKSTLFEGHVILNMWYPIYYIFNFFMVCLFVFHILWTYLILRVFVNKFAVKRIEDLRSDSEISASFSETEHVNSDKKVQ